MTASGDGTSIPSRPAGYASSSGACGPPRAELDEDSCAAVTTRLEPMGGICLSGGFFAWLIDEAFA